MADATAEWEQKYQATSDAHQRQNTAITADFAKALKPDSQIYAAFTDIKKVLEIGCGTGEMAAWVADKFGSDVTGIDLSRTAIAIAQIHHGGKANFWAGSFVDAKEHYDLVIASHVLEHFKDYRGILREWLKIAPLVLIIVPFEESEYQGDYLEGGIRHRSRFDEKALKRFKVVDSLLFTSAGWQNGENPRNWAVLVER
jgi:SAM-dependent methyltransferase